MLHRTTHRSTHRGPVAGNLGRSRIVSPDVRHRDRLLPDGAAVWRAIARDTAAALVVTVLGGLVVLAVGVAGGSLDPDRVLLQDRALDARVLGHTSTTEACGKNRTVRQRVHEVTWTTPDGERAEATVTSCRTGTGDTHPVRVTPAQERAAVDGERPDVPSGSIATVYVAVLGIGIGLGLAVGWLRTRPYARKARRQQRDRAAHRRALMTSLREARRGLFSDEGTQPVDERRGGPTDEA